MSGIQKFYAIGNLGNDPETFNGGARFSVAVTEKWRDKNSGEVREQTEWLKCVAFGKTGDLAAQYLKKGSKVYVEGKLQTDSYEKEGQKHWSTSVIVRELKFLDSRGESQGQQPQQSTPAPVGDEFSQDIPFSPLDGRLY